MTTLRGIRAWIAVHYWRAALLTLGIAAIIFLFFGDYTIETIGVINLRPSVPLVTILPTLAAYAITLFNTNQVERSLPDPAVARWARLAALLTATLVTIGVWIAINTLRGEETLPWMGIRNILFFTALAVFAAIAVKPSSVSLVLIGSVLVALMFGASPEIESRYSPWLFVLNGDVTTEEWFFAAIPFAGAVVAHTLLRQRGANA